MPWVYSRAQSVFSATDWFEDGWSLEESIALSKLLEARGVDLIDVSSGGLAKAQPITLGPGYQMDFAQAIKEQVSIVVGTVGMITEAQQAEGVDLSWPGQYERAKL
jgi:2,4-dienoyl-CoA reductase-like NADH-dependent reductase (Old Yellow Enzyme family)